LVGVLILTLLTNKFKWNRVEATILILPKRRGQAGRSIAYLYQPYLAFTLLWLWKEYGAHCSDYQLKAIIRRIGGMSWVLVKAISVISRIIGDVRPTDFIEGQGRR
jgi:hypothetical protein